MNHAAIRLLTAAVWAAVSLCAQQQQRPPIFETINCIKVTRGKGAEYRQFLREETHKFMQARADSGEIAAWVLLRTVIPAGADARCDYVSITSHVGTPVAPMSREAAGAALQKVGLNPVDYFAKRDQLSRLVSTEIWRQAIFTGRPQKGNYLYTNFMKVHNLQEYAKFEREVWRPMAEQWIKEGSMSGWVMNVAVLPGGTDLKYAALSVDIFPNWEATFKPRNTRSMFSNVHTGKNYQETMAGLSKLRDLARRELSVIEDMVTPAK
ncbi:MAG: hypothetical protein IT165_37025 [Bryobacterales bacterium]|nr:hypothetical protein [Bryobacterales bacterium]